jgi:hypothetical protein
LYLIEVENDVRLLRNKGTHMMTVCRTFRSKYLTAEERESLTAPYSILISDLEQHISSAKYLDEQILPNCGTFLATGPNPVSPEPDLCWLIPSGESFEIVLISRIYDLK